MSFKATTPLQLIESELKEHHELLEECLPLFQMASKKPVFPTEALLFLLWQMSTDFYIMSQFKAIEDLERWLADELLAKIMDCGMPLHSKEMLDIYMNMSLLYDSLLYYTGEKDVKYIINLVTFYSLMGQYVGLIGKGMVKAGFPLENKLVVYLWDMCAKMDEYSTYGLSYLVLSAAFDDVDDVSYHCCMVLEDLDMPEATAFYLSCEEIGKMPRKDLKRMYRYM